MPYSKVTAILQCDKLEKVEMALKIVGVSGVSVTYVKGGDYTDFFQSPPQVTHARVEVFTEDSNISAIADSIR